VIINLNLFSSQAKTERDGEKTSRNCLSNNTEEGNVVTGDVMSEEKRQCNESDLIKTDVASRVQEQANLNEVTSSNGGTCSDIITQEDKSKCSRLELLLNASQLISELYPLPGNEECCNFVFTQNKYDPVTDQSPMFSIDCEWCICVDGKYFLFNIRVIMPSFPTFVSHTSLEFSCF
jgi:hypothetical protein